MAFFKTAPAWNFGAFEAAILRGSPVRGLRLSRAARWVTLKVPNPTSRTSCPALRDLLTASVKALRAFPASVLERQESPLPFSPNLNPYFDHGWAVTIHKSQGTTVDKTFVLASSEMSRNLSYVAMTRHREKCQVFGSSLDFWRTEKLPELLSQSGEKLTAGDYLDAHSLTKLMKSDDKLITKVFSRLSNELTAMGAVTKEAFWQVADRFLGITREKDRVGPEHLGLTLREEGRAEKLLPKEHHEKPSRNEISLEKSQALSPQHDTRKHQGLQGSREVTGKPLSSALLKENRNTESPQKSLKQEECQRQAEQLQQDRQARQIREDQRRHLEKERIRVKQKDLSM